MRHRVVGGPVVANFCAAALVACAGLVPDLKVGPTFPTISVPLAAQSSSHGDPSSQKTDLDALMARVLKQREESWRRLHEYVLSEKERFDIRDAEGQSLYAGRREYVWYIRDGYFIRSPVRSAGVTISESDRRTYEARWLKEEKQREAKAAEQNASTSDDGESVDEATSAQELVADGVEPRFISEAYFLDFTFEQGRYYFAGRETLQGREVLRIEYYPSRLFDLDDEDEAEQSEDSRRRARDEDEEEFLRKLNKVALITLWVDPKHEQIVKYTFDNTGFDFFPLRWLVREDEFTASMVMAPYLRGFWVPKAITAYASFTLASGTVEVEYEREFFDYRKAETRARMRVGGSVER